MTSRRLGCEVFPATADSVAAVRRWLRGRLGPGHPAADDAVLLLSEAFTNSVLHSDGGKVSVSAFTDGDADGDGVRVEVVDPGGDTLPHYTDDVRGEGGRGLHIIRALARDWGFEPVREGLKVWFEAGPDDMRRCRGGS
jgi:anti-sigma regulatory factor (Ser/Thr protein kinase)